MITCIAIDDEPLALDIIETYCSRVPFLKLEKSFTRTSEAAKFLRQFPIDLIFIDIRMPDITGIEFYRSFGQDTMVIFTTAYAEYAVEGFSLRAVDYLLKPISFERFIQAASHAAEYYRFLHQKDSHAQSLYVRSEYKLVRIPLNEITYIETLDDYLKIHQTGKKPVLTIMSIKTMMDKLPPNEFIRVHRSFIVPLSRIEAVRGRQIHVGTAEIPIGNTYEAAFFKAYMKDHF